jgi:2-methylcitrate dehydratase PrpD
VNSPLIEQLTVKPFPCCGHTFAAIEAALQLHHSGAVPDNPRDLDAVTVSTYRTALEVAGNPDPHTVPGARFSLAYTVAIALLDGGIDQSSFTPARIADPRRRALSERVHIEVDTEFEAAFPALRGAAVTLNPRHGERASRVIPDRPGSPRNPLSPETISAKFTGLVRPSLGKTGADRLHDRIRDLSRLASVRELTWSSAASHLKNQAKTVKER